MSLLVPAGIDASPERSQGWITAALAGAAVCFATLPIVVHLTATQSNPFYFAAVARLVQISVLAGIVWRFKASCLEAFFDEPDSRRRSSPAVASGRVRPKTDDGVGRGRSNRGRLLSWRDHLCVFASAGGAAGTNRVELRVCRTPSRSLDWIRMPLIGALVGSFDYALFAWSTQYVETAVAATAYEMWPLMLMSAMAAHQRRDRFYRGEVSAVSAEILTKGQLLLGVMAAVGLAAATLSQHSGGERLSAAGVFGVLLALAGGAASTLSVVASVAYGKMLFYRLAERCNQRPGHPDSGDRRRLMLLLWLTMLGHVIAKLCSLPVLFATGVAVFGADAGLDTEALAGAALFGLAISAASTLIRVGNIETPSPAANVVLFASPVLALGLLAVAGIDLARIELFVAGAALVVTANMAAQWSSQRRP